MEEERRKATRQRRKWDQTPISPMPTEEQMQATTARADAIEEYYRANPRTHEEIRVDFVHEPDLTPCQCDRCVDIRKNRKYGRPACPSEVM